MSNVSSCSMLISNTGNRLSAFCNQILTVRGHIYLSPIRSGNVKLGDPTSHRKQSAQCSQEHTSHSSSI
jgi:hypothetical protein